MGGAVRAREADNLPAARMNRLALLKSGGHSDGGTINAQRRGRLRLGPSRDCTWLIHTVSRDKDRWADRC